MRKKNRINYTVFDKDNRCKKCKATLYECKYCFDKEFYRKKEDKEQMKYNLKHIRIKLSQALEFLIEKRFQNEMEDY